MHSGTIQASAFTFLFLFTAILDGQSLMRSSGSEDAIRLLPSDSAVLELREPRSDLPCAVKPVKPQMGFDLKFHSGYQVTVPVKELAQAGDVLTMILRVAPEDGETAQTYFRQRAAVPPVDDNARGDAFLEGSFDLGEGKYQVDWLMRDRAGRFCSAYWEVSVSPPAKDRGMLTQIPPGVVRPPDANLFEDEAPVPASPREGLYHAKILVNFAPQTGDRVTLRPDDLNGLISILHRIAREPLIGTFSLVAFNAGQQQVIFRQENAARIDFHALGQALKSLNLATINVNKLGRKNGDADFLASLAAEEASKDSPDVIIFVGPKVLSENGVSGEQLKQLGDADFPVFYLDYNLEPQLRPWRDAIGSVVKHWKGMEFTIARPRDLLHSWAEIMSQVAHRSHGRRSAAGGQQMEKVASMLESGN